MAHLISSRENSAPTVAPHLLDYKTLVNHYYQDLYHYAYWLSKNRTQAEDLVQNTYLRAWRSWGSEKSRVSVKSWLFTILNLENVRLHQRNHPATVELDDQVMANGFSPEYEKNTDGQSLQQTLMQLPLNYREPLLLQIIGGFTINEIAEILDLKLSTVLTRLFRAKMKLTSTLS